MKQFFFVVAIECDEIGAFASNSTKNKETITSCITNLRENTHFPFFFGLFFFFFSFAASSISIHFCRNYENFTRDTQKKMFQFKTKKKERKWTKPKNQNSMNEIHHEMVQQINEQKNKKPAPAKWRALSSQWNNFFSCFVNCLWSRTLWHYNNSQMQI